MAGRKQPPRYATCHQEKAYYSKGLCETCYRRQNANISCYMKAYLREWRKKNKAKVDGYTAKRMADPVKRARVRERQYASRVRSKYGLTDDAVRAMRDAQGDKCAICSQKMDKLFIDHCHVSGKVRSLLCHGCNSGLGMFRDSIPSLLRAANYILEHQSAAKQDTIDRLAK